MTRPSLVVVTPWYPTETGPYDGVFVREAVAALRRPAEEVLVVHLHNQPPEEVGPPVRVRTEEAEVLHIGVPVPPRTPRADMARAQRAALAAAMPPELLAADVVHAHVGMPTGWAVAGLLPARTRLVVTEHATYLPTILRTPVGARMYGEMLTRTAWLLTVGEKEARELREQFPQAAARIRSVGNPVREDRFAPRAEVPRALDRWLYVGNLIPRKGVLTLVEALGRRVATEPDRATTLTLVGDGPQRAELERRATELGVADRVRFHGPATPDEVARIFTSSDVLLHLSAHETFGLTVVEAAMTGLPVVVTECGGPSETLAHAAAEGLVRLVPLPPSADAVVAAVAGLERDAPSADRDAVRSVLVDRYGATRLGERLERVYAGEEPSAGTEPVPVTVLGVALSPAGTARMAALLPEALRAGGRAVLLTDQRGDAAARDRRVAVVDLAPHERRTPHHALEELLLWRVPAGALRAARALSAVLAELPGPQRAAAGRGVHALSALIARHRRVAAGVHKRLLHPVLYARTDPARIARYVVRERLDEVLVHRPDVVLVEGAEAGPLVERLRRELPDAVILSGGSERDVREAVRGRG